MLNIVYTNICEKQGYKKLMTKSYQIIYKILEEQKEVVIVFIKYVKMNV